MVDEATLKLAESELKRLIEVCHKQGLSYPEIERLLFSAYLSLKELPDQPLAKTDY